MLYISMPAQIIELPNEDRIVVKALDMTGVGSDAYSALIDLETQLQKILILPIELEMQPIKDNRVLLISNYGDYIRDLIWESSPEIFTGSNERKKRIENGKLKSSK